MNVCGSKVQSLEKNSGGGGGRGEIKDINTIGTEHRGKKLKRKDMSKVS